MRPARALKSHVVMMFSFCENSSNLLCCFVLLVVELTEWGVNDGVWDHVFLIFEQINTYECYVNCWQEVRIAVIAEIFRGSRSQKHLKCPSGSGYPLSFLWLTLASPRNEKVAIWLWSKIRRAWAFSSRCLVWLYPASTFPSLIKFWDAQVFWEYQ